METTLIIFVILNMVAGVVLSCPHQCECYVDQFRNFHVASGLRIMNCTGVDFLSEHSKIFHEVEVLNIITDGGKPIRLKDDMFKQFAKLKQLNLNNCKINHVPKNVFKGLKKIQEINLSYNDIRDFDNSVFENINSLHKLSLRGNPIHVSFKPYLSSKSLTDLDLGDCKIYSLQNEFFHGVKRVSHLYLDGNYLQTVKDQVLPRGLVYLNLAGNRIVNVPIETILSLSQLRRLDLSGNPIKCTCSVLNLQDRLSGSGVITDKDVICASPPEVRNINWSKVNENELCMKEVFSERRHAKRPQAQRFVPYFKKERYFENEKYGHYENFQADQPDQTADYMDGPSDDYDDYIGDTQDKELINDEKKKESEPTSSTGGHPQQDGVTSNVTEQQAAVQNTPESENAVEDVNNDKEGDLPTISNTKEEIQKQEEEKEKKDVQEGIAENPEKVDNESAMTNTDNAASAGAAEEKDLNKNDEIAEDATAAPYPEVIIDKTESKGEKLDEDLTKADEILPVGGKITEGEEKEEKEGDKTQEFNEDHDKVEEDSNKEIQEKIPDELEKAGEVEEPISGKENEEDQEKNAKDDEVIKLVVTEPTESKGIIDNVSPRNILTGTTATYDQEGSGDVSKEESPVNVTLEIPVEVPEIAKKPEVYPQPERTGELSEQTVDRKPLLEYEAMGSYIVAICIVVLVVVLILISIIKVCRSSKKKRSPAADVEANTGTELQDMASLLPTAVNGDAEKHNSKYPNEAPSAETVNLIKADKVKEPDEPTDLNQNDSKNEVMKNGKAVEDSVPPPVEVAKAKFTVLLESIPRTPVFIQKRSINNG